MIVQMIYTEKRKGERKGTENTAILHDTKGNRLDFVLDNYGHFLEKDTEILDFIAGKKDNFEIEHHVSSEYIIIKKAKIIPF